MRNKLKRAAETTSERLREVFNETCREDPLKKMISFQQIESSMFKRRRCLFPPLPKDAEDFSKLIVASPFTHLYRGTVIHDGAVAVILAADFMLMKTSNADIIQFDGTFYTVPSLFYQLFTIFVPFRGHCIPAIYVLMQNKTEGLYSAIILKLLEHIPEFSPRLAVSDFEKAPRNAFMYFFPQMKMIGYWFHFTQAIWKKTQILGLGKLYKTEEIYADCFRKLMVMPLLPQSEIRITFSVLEAQVFELCGTDIELVNKFKKYIKKTWILGEKNLSVYSSQIATNNGCESFHK